MWQTGFFFFSSPESKDKTEFCRTYCIFMPPTSKKLRGQIGMGLSVQSVSPSVMRENA